MKKKINVVITDDHRLFRKGIRALLLDFDFTGYVKEAENGEELLALLAEETILPDVILLDLRMPVMDGVEAQKMIKKLYPQIRTIILTMEDDDQFIIHLVNEGVNGYLLKNADPDEMEMAIKKVVEQGFFFSNDISKLVMSSLVNKEKHDPLLNIDITERELEILELICAELTAIQIGDKLSLSARTIEGYRRRLMEKTRTKNMAGLVIFAIKNHLVKI